MAKTNNLRIITTVKPGTNRELYEDLAAMPPGDRSERIRMLAAFGVLAMRGRLVPAGASPAAADELNREGPLMGTPVAAGVLAGFDDGGWEPTQD